MVVYDIQVVYVPLRPDIIDQVAVCILVNTLSVPITKRKREMEIDTVSLAALLIIHLADPVFLLRPKILHLL